MDMKLKVTNEEFTALCLFGFLSLAALIYSVGESLGKKLEQVNQTIIRVGTIDDFK